MCWYNNEEILNRILDYSCENIIQNTNYTRENIKGILQSDRNLHTRIVLCLHSFPGDQDMPRHYAAERFFEALFEENLLEPENLTFAFVSLWTMKRPFEYFSQEKLLEIFNSVNKPMVDYDTCIDELDEHIIIYRGIRGDVVDENNWGYSWTLDKKVAINFATGNHQCNGIILEGEARRDDIIGYFKNRDEKEIVILPKNVQSIHYQSIRMVMPNMG